MKYSLVPYFFIIFFGCATSSFGKTCEPVSLTVINMYEAPITLISANKKVVLKPKSSKQLTITPHYFYKRCGRLHLIYGDTHEDVYAVIKKHTKDVHLRINADGRVDHSGLHHAGFDVKEYISWHGLAALLQE